MNHRSVAFAIIKRWFRVLSLTTVTSIATHLIVPWALNLAERRPVLPTINLVALATSILIALAAGGHLLSALSPVRLRQLRYALRYPPLWLALCLVPLVLFLGHSYTARLRFDPDVVASLWPLYGGSGAVAFAIGYLGRSLAVPYRSERTSFGPVERVEEDLDWPAIEGWMALEQESSDDLLNHAQIARRFARVLRSGGRSAALIGPWGSGKTTILRWVASNLESHKKPEIWCCWVSCWGIQDSKQLAAYVLRTLVASIDSRVDAFELRGIPEAYVQMLSATQFGPVASILRQNSEQDVLETLERIPVILSVVNARLVLFIEDGDRTGGPQFDHGHLERLISRLHDLDRVSCVISFDQTRLQLDITRLCEHIERLTQLDTETVRNILGLTREHCLDDFTFIRPERIGEQADLLDLKRGGSLLRYVRKAHDRDVCDTIRDLVQTPRRLKHVVRRVARTWTQLYGEVDVDHLIAMAVLQECCPSVFTFLLSNIEGLRREADQFNKRPEYAKKEWENLTSSDAVASLAVNLVHTFGLHQLRTGAIGGGQRVQGITRDSPTDYFQRICAGELSPGDVSDQEVLRDIEAWLNHDEPRLPNRLTSSKDELRYSQVWGYFAWRIPDGKLPAFTDQLFTRIITSVSIDGRWQRNRAFGECLQQQKQRDRNAFVGPTRLKRMVSQALPESLDLACDLYRFWATTSHGLCTSEERADIRRSMAADAETLLAGSSQLLRALRFDENGEGWTLRALVIPDDRDEPKSVDSEIERWQWLAKPLNGALSQDPTLIAPQVARLVGEGADRMRADGVQKIYVLNRERVAKLFGSDLRGFLAALSRVSPPPNDEYCRQAVDQSREWLSEPS